MAGTAQQVKKKGARKGAPKPKMTKEERKEKYTKLAREREGKRRRRLNSTNLICFQCRQKGHAVADCPNNKSKEKSKKQSTSTTGICYKCGSTEHPLSKCPKRNDGSDELPYCHCFVCNEMGHLSSKCPKNEQGIFVNGGACKTCGSKFHLSSDCPEREDANTKKEKSVTGQPDIDPATLEVGEGDELVDAEEKTEGSSKQKDGKDKKKKPRKVVNF